MIWQASNGIVLLHFSYNWYLLLKIDQEDIQNDNFLEKKLFQDEIGAAKVIG